MMKNEIITKIDEKIDWDHIFSNCNITRDRDDMKQMILLTLLEMKFSNLNNIWKNNTYKFYIIRIILNQRNGKNTEYNLRNRRMPTDDYKNSQTFMFQEFENNIKELREEKITTVFDIMMTKTDDELLNFSLQLFHAYYIRKYVKKDGIIYTKFAKELKMSRTKLFNLINIAKKHIREEYDRINNTINNDC